MKFLLTEPDFSANLEGDPGSPTTERQLILVLDLVSSLELLLKANSLETCFDYFLKSIRLESILLASLAILELLVSPLIKVPLRSNVDSRFKVPLRPIVVKRCNPPSLTGDFFA